MYTSSIVDSCPPTSSLPSAWTNTHVGGLGTAAPLLSPSVTCSLHFVPDGSKSQEMSASSLSAPRTDPAGVSRQPAEPGPCRV